MSPDKIKEAIFLALGLLVMGVIPFVLTTLQGPSDLERKFYYGAVLLFGALMLALLTWKKAPEPAEKAGHAKDRSSNPPAPRRTRVAGIVGAIGGSLGVPIVGLVALGSGVPKDVLMHGIAGMIAGILVPLSCAVLIGAVVTHVRRRKT